MVQRLAWVTSAPARGTDPDEPLALAEIRRHGVTVEVVDWEDPAVRWDSYDRAVLRSPWNYQARPSEFLDWLTRVERLVEVRNPAAAVRWSLDKRYLGELDAAGVPVIDTLFVGPGEPSAVVGDTWVVKPSIGAGSSDVAVFHAGQEAASRQHIEYLHRRGLTALVQPLIRSVTDEGEWPMVFFDGAFSHSANKFVRLQGAGDEERLFAREDNVPHRANAQQIAVATQAMQAVQQRFGPLTYARVDLVRDDHDGYLVLEVEIFEPSLFLPEGGPGAVERCAAALIA